MNLCHNRYGKNAEYMVKCQQRLEFMRICRISVLMSLYQQYLQSKKIEKGFEEEDINKLKNINEDFFNKYKDNVLNRINKLKNIVNICLEYT